VSDDGGSAALTLFALMEAAKFASHLLATILQKEQHSREMPQGIFSIKSHFLL